MNICTAKFKPKNEKEVAWVKSVLEKFSELVSVDGLPPCRIRIGRQVKSYGSAGVASYKTEIRDNIFGVWINGHHADNIDLDKVVRHYVKSCLNWKHAQPFIQNMTEDQKTFLKIKYNI